VFTKLESAYIRPAAVYLILSTSCYFGILQIINQYFLNASQDEIRTYMSPFALECLVKCWIGVSYLTMWSEIVEF
jgi:hypothetical protein